MPTHQSLLWYVQNAVLSYDTRPIEDQTHGSEELNIRLYGDRVRDIYKARKGEAEQAPPQPVAAGVGAKPRL